MKYRKKPVVIDAVQWFKNGDHPAVEGRFAQLIYSANHKHFYLSHPDAKADCWLPVDRTAAEQEGAELPFAFWEVKSGTRINCDWDADRDAGLLSEQWEHVKRACFSIGKNYWDLRPYGLIRTLEDGVQTRHIVTEGDWIITGVLGERYPCKPEMFERTYELDEPAAQGA